MEAPIITIKQLVSEAQCYATIRQLRWQEGVSCPGCESSQIIKRGHDDKQRACQRYQCKSCGKRFDDLSGTVLSGHHQPLSVWVLCLYFMGLNLSNQQIAQELGLNKDDLQYMAEHLRTGIDNLKVTSKKKSRQSSQEKLNVMKSIWLQVIRGSRIRSPLRTGSRAGVD